MTELEKKIGYTFENAGLLKHALTHSSYINEHHLVKQDCNERLEFLGDAILEMVSSEYFYHHYPEKMEGELSKLRASLVCEKSLADCARTIGLGSCIYMGKGMELSGGRESDAIISDAFEALIAAMFLDGGEKAARDLILTYVLNDIEDKILFTDSKTILQELLQEKGKQVTYELKSESGPEHMKVFEVEAVIDGRGYGIGSGHSKKQAQQNAAYETIRMIRKTDSCI